MRADPQATPASDLQVRVLEDAWPEAAESLCALPSASFFQRPQWFRAVQRAESRLAPFVLTVSDATGSLQGAWLFAAVRRWGLTRLYAGPWGTYGGILARHAAAATALRQALPRLVARRRIVLVRVHDFQLPYGKEGVEPFWSLRPEVCQVLDLPEDASVLFRDAFTSQNRNKIRKAEKAGLRVRRAANAAALQAYARLYGQSTKRWQLRRTLPERFFAALAGIDGVEVWLAEDREGPVAALLNLRAGGQIMNWGNVSLRRSWHQAPNNLLHWKAIEAACGDPTAPRLYNFGSSAGLPGVYAFKAAFGAREHVYTRSEHRSRILAWTRRGRGEGR
jgi:hypothetical protein